MRKFFTILTVVSAVMLGLISCSNNEIEVPDGLQIVKVSESDGYQFFGPEGWIVANDAEIAASYVSSINNTSITFAEIDPPDVSVSEYFAEEKTKFAYEITVAEEKETTFGNAERAYSFVYTFTYEERDFASMQIIIENGGKFYVFTYTSYGDPASEDSEYQNYLEVVRLAIDSFRFTEATAAESEASEYPTDEDGYILVSDKGLSGFELYVPADSEVVTSSAQVTVKLSDGANLNITKSSATGVSIIDYLETRKSDLERIFGEVTDLKIELYTVPDLTGDNAELFAAFDVSPTANPQLIFGNLDSSKTIAYEYTYTHLETTYHVYQILGVDSQNGYVLTYTATEEEYTSHLETLAKILQKVKFR